MTDWAYSDDGTEFLIHTPHTPRPWITATCDQCDHGTFTFPIQVIPESADPQKT